MRTTCGYLWWAVLVIPLWIVLILCMSWEPVMRDAWANIWWVREHPIKLGTLYESVKHSYALENPRLGQQYMLAAYMPGPYHLIVTPIVELGMFALLTTLALGRWPSVRRSDDALAGALVTALVVACTPQIGPQLFYQPFIGNYVVGLVLNLLWLVPYRLELAAPRPPRRWLAPVMFGLGVAAGLCNEHTGLAFLAMGTLAWIAHARRRGRASVWMIAGLIGLAAGYVALLTAPGQHLRYEGLADQAGIFARIAERGLAGNLRVLGVLVAAVAWMLPVIVVAVVERSTGGAPTLPRTERAVHAVFALAGVACTLSLLGSPRIGPRLYLASVALIAVGLTGWLVVQLRSTWARRVCGALAASALVYVGGRCVSIYRVVGPFGAARFDRVERAAPGTVVTLPRYPCAPSRYFLGEDLNNDSLRKWIAERRGLAAVVLEAAP